MKLVHLSDLHLGKRLNEFSLIEDQEDILNKILAIVRAEAPDGVMIAGDVYDKAVPSAEAVALFDRFLVGLAELTPHIFVISGNHDSPERIAFAAHLLSRAGIHLSPVYDGRVRPVELTDEFGTAAVYLLPFIKPAHVRRVFPEETIDTYTDALGAAVAHLELDQRKRNILVTHQFVTGAARSESEEISVGGADNVDGAVFAPFDYVALGHLHGPQNVGSSRIRYCGTPLKYSFSEASQYKSVTVAELGEKGDLTLHTVPLTPRHDMRVIQGTFAQLTAENSDAAGEREDYLHIILTDEEDVPEALGRLRLVYPNILKLSYDNTRTRTSQSVDRAQRVAQKSPLELFEELYETQNNQPMSQEQRDFAQRLIEQLREEDA